MNFVNISFTQDLIIKAVSWWWNNFRFAYKLLKFGKIVFLRNMTWFLHTLRFHWILAPFFKLLWSFTKKIKIKVSRYKSEILIIIRIKWTNLFEKINKSLYRKIEQTFFIQLKINKLRFTSCLASTILTILLEHPKITSHP